MSEDPEGKYDFVHLFATNSEELSELRHMAMEAMEYDGLLSN